MALHVSFELGATTYTIKAAREAVLEEESVRTDFMECQRQREQLSGWIWELVLDYQRLGNKICWSGFVS